MVIELGLRIHWFVLVDLMIHESSSCAEIDVHVLEAKKVVYGRLRRADERAIVARHDQARREFAGHSVRTSKAGRVQARDSCHRRVGGHER
jgi:hypothetical protein